MLIQSYRSWTSANSVPFMVNIPSLDINDKLTLKCFFFRMGLEDLAELPKPSFCAVMNWSNGACSTTCGSRRHHGYINVPVQISSFVDWASPATRIDMCHVIARQVGLAILQNFFSNPTCFWKFKKLSSVMKNTERMTNFPQSIFWRGYSVVHFQDIDR